MFYKYLSRVKNPKSGEGLSELQIGGLSFKNIIVLDVFQRLRKSNFVPFYIKIKKEYYEKTAIVFTAQKMKFSIRIWSYLLKKSLKVH